MPDFSKTRVLLSFGAAAGGFEFAMALRRDIMGKYGKSEQADPEFVYVDAESLRNEAQTRYTWDAALGIYKMSNPCWDTFYKSAMSRCDFMVFLLSAPWLKSNWCWDEFQWYQLVLAQRAVTPVFVVFKDAQAALAGSSMVRDAKGGQHDLKPLWQQMIAHKNAAVIDISSEAEAGLGTVSVEGASYTYTHKYVCSAQERQAILNKVIVLQP